MAVELLSSSLFSDANLVNYYRFEGNSNDSKGSDNGTDTNIAYSTANGRFGQGAGFNGSTSKITLATLPFSGTGNFTLLAWVKTSTTATQQPLFTLGDTSTNGKAVLFYINTSNQIQTDVSAQPGPNSAGTVTDGVFHLLAVTNTSGTFQNYIDGVASGGTGSLTPNIGGGSQIIGNNSTTWLNGAMDDAAIFTRALSAAEMLAFYNATIDSGYAFFM